MSRLSTVSCFRFLEPLPALPRRCDAWFAFSVSSGSESDIVMQSAVLSWWGGSSWAISHTEPLSLDESSDDSDEISYVIFGRQMVSISTAVSMLLLTFSFSTGIPILRSKKQMFHAVHVSWKRKKSFTFSKHFSHILVVSSSFLTWNRDTSFKLAGKKQHRMAKKGDYLLALQGIAIFAGTMWFRRGYRPKCLCCVGRQCHTIGIEKINSIKICLPSPKQLGTQLIRRRFLVDRED